MRKLHLLVLAATGLLVACSPSEKPIANGESVAGGEGAINLEQGWSRQVQDRAWFTSFGSRLIPTAWLRALEQADNPQRFMADANMDALGFLLQSATSNN